MLRGGFEWVVVIVLLDFGGIFCFSLFCCFFPRWLAGKKQSGLLNDIGGLGTHLLLFYLFRKRYSLQADRTVHDRWVVFGGGEVGKEFLGSGKC